MRTTIQTPNQSTTDLHDNLLREITRVRELLGIYNSLPNNVGIVSAQRLKIHLAQAEKALRDNDVIQMLQMYSILQECQ
ncbi:hypothetical protein [Emticicia soli]|uniref:Uncharacterized protein n=1 Tax=Emticicia soli TaxID=2027878 RepID=A0ABW5J2G5_9BACT